MIVPIFWMEIFIRRAKRKWIEIVFHRLELHLCYLKRTLFGMHSANLDRFANFGPLLLETMDPFQVSKWNYHPQVCYCLKLTRLWNIILQKNIPRTTNLLTNNLITKDGVESLKR